MRFTKSEFTSLFLQESNINSVEHVYTFLYYYYYYYLFFQLMPEGGQTLSQKKKKESILNILNPDNLL